MVLSEKLALSQRVTREMCMGRLHGSANDALLVSKSTVPDPECCRRLLVAVSLLQLVKSHTDEDLRWFAVVLGLVKSNKVQIMKLTLLGSHQISTRHKR